MHVIPSAPLTERTGRRVAEALERQANALEAMTMMLQVFLSEEESAAEPNFPKTIMTQQGPVELR